MHILLSSALSLLLVCGCAMIHSQTASVALPSREELGTDRVLTNAHVVIWIPSRVAHVSEGRVTSVKLYETTPSGAFVKAHRITSKITIRTKQEFQEHTRFFKEYPIDQEHPSLTLFDVPLGKSLRQDIRDPERDRVISISFNVHKSDTFQEDVETARKVVESIRLLKVQPDETDFLNPLTFAEVKRVKEEIGNLQPYMTPKDCVVAPRP